MSAADRRRLAQEIFAAMLRAASKHRTSVEHLDLAAAGLDASKWLAVVGVDATTRVNLKVEKSGNAPAFIFSSADRDNKWGDADPASTASCQT
jgi:hypothetical protein